MTWFDYLYYGLLVGVPLLIGVAGYFKVRSKKAQQKECQHDFRRCTKCNEVAV